MKNGSPARIRRIKKLLENLAYISVILDFLITAFSFILIKTSSVTAKILLIYVDYALSAEMVLIILALVALLLLSYYDKVLDTISSISPIKFRMQGNAGSGKVQKAKGPRIRKWGV
jgi:hypothetical protein